MHTSTTGEIATPPTLPTTVSAQKLNFKIKWNVKTGETYQESTGGSPTRRRKSVYTSRKEMQNPYETLVEPYLEGSAQGDGDRT